MTEFSEKEQIVLLYACSAINIRPVNYVRCGILSMKKKMLYM